MGFFRKARQAMQSLTEAGLALGKAAREHEPGGEAASPTAAPSPPEPAPEVSPAPTAPRDVIAKAVIVQVWVEVTGMHPAPQDFAALATTAVHRALADHVTTDGMALRLRVVRTSVDDGSADDADLPHA